MSEVEQYLHGCRTMLQRELVLLEARVKSITLEVKELKVSIEYQKQLSKYKDTVKWKGQEDHGVGQESQCRITNCQVCATIRQNEYEKQR